MDYEEEQEQELEVLKSIYPNELEEIGDKVFRIILEPEESDSSAPQYTPKYPEEIPDISIDVINGTLKEAEKEKLNSELINAQDSLGMAMIFTLSSLLKDLVTSFVVERKERITKEEEIRVLKEIEAEQNKFQGTKVTVASFLEWREKFNKDMAEKEKLEKSSAALKKEEAKKNKLTGRQLFEQDETLVNSDATFMEEGDVTVDASLFEQEIVYSDEDDENNVLEL
ncbi:9041_t:CDS:2 [Diversispora eburnea]|uniref:9041_t:CDS:1 n=1 Tax=Diversispora eburnea TaxID=1213867 RepID=A0A9N9A192_9GLOM|nr:9041_t:CDS:2 [Diversispora eburnea]